MSNKQRFRRLTDLFVRGKSVRMPDSSYLWVQALNDFERDEALNDAQIARARLVMAMKSSGSERLKAQARLAEVGRVQLEEELAEKKTTAKAADFINGMRADPEWKERMDIVMRTVWEEEAKPATDEEVAFMAQLNQEVLDELVKREQDERDYQMRQVESLSEDELVDAWVEEWLDRRGSERATAEYKLTELWFATRYCAATGEDLETLDHSRCEGHHEQVFADKAEARSVPDELSGLLRSALDTLGMDGTDPKDSASRPPSSDSSPTPSEPGESTPSTSTTTPATPPGTSPRPSLTA